MKRPFKAALGVTLLEIMLVLAIAAMIIVVSIKYYQNATNSQNTNVIMEEIQNITAAADNLAQGTGSYSAATSAALKSVAGSSNMKTPYGTAISVSSQSATGYTVTIPTLPDAVCTSVASKLAANTKFTSPKCSGGTVSYTYNSTQ